MTATDPRALLRAMFDAAVRAAQPEVCLAPHVAELARPKGRTVVVGAGKASAAMARAFETLWPHRIDAGLVVTRDGHAAPTRRIEIVEASHPVPDARGRDAARRILELVRGLGPDDLVVALVSGGGSALLTWPAEGLSLDDKRAVNDALLKSGAPIDEMNTVRKHLSAIKGGRLALAARPARVVAYLVSDVPRDDPSVIGSGPTVPDPSTYADALAVLAKRKIEPPAAVRSHLEAGVAGRIPETPKPGDPSLSHVRTIMTATPQRSLEAAADVARAAGYAPEILGDSLEGLAREVGAEHAALARRRASEGKKVALISGGETTVVVRGTGRGGRNVEYLLAHAIALDGAQGVHALAGDTDGVDGREEIAGALAGPDTLARASRLGLNPQASLNNNDGHGFFQALGDSVVTGPTLTNVNDFRATLIGAP